MFLVASETISNC